MATNKELYRVMAAVRKSRQASFVTNDSLDISQAQTAWAGVGKLLEQAASELNKTANGESKKLASFGLNQRHSCSLVKN